MSMKKTKPPISVRLSSKNEIKLEKIQEEMKLDNRNQVINTMVDQWEYVLKWLPACSSLANLLNELEKHRKGITIEEFNKKWDILRAKQINIMIPNLKNVNKKAKKVLQKRPKSNTKTISNIKS